MILGSGVQGIACALALHRKGHEVVLIDQCAEPFSRTSFRNEAKIHLGFVYANDPSFQTSALMLRAALEFGPLLEEWLGRPVPWDDFRSNRFTYLVHRDTMLGGDALLEHYARLQDLYAELRTPRTHYLGVRPDQLWWPDSELPACVNPEVISRSISTEEVAVDLTKIRHLLVGAVGERGVAFKGNRVVSAVERTPAGFRVEGQTTDGRPWSEEGGIVVNCLWAGRLGVDATLGIVPNHRWVYRLKYRLLGQLPPHLAAVPSYTMVLGAYGDVATYPGGDTYLSWYPACMRGWSGEVHPPREWNDACNGHVPDAERTAPWVGNALDGLDAIFPGMSAFKVTHVDAGVIYSKGHTDIDDYGSDLHHRYQVGVNAHDGYFSVNTGKFTCAPLFARHLQEQL